MMRIAISLTALLGLGLAAQGKDFGPWGGPFGSHGHGSHFMLLFNKIHQHGPLFNYGPYYGYPPFEPYGPWNMYLQYGAYSNHGMGYTYPSPTSPTADATVNNSHFSAMPYPSPLTSYAPNTVFHPSATLSPSVANGGHAPGVIYQQTAWPTPNYYPAPRTGSVR